MFQWQPYALLPLTGAIIAPAIVWYALRRRSSTPAAAGLALVSAGLGLWAAEDAIGAFSTSLEFRTNLALVRFPAIQAGVLGFCWLAWSLIQGDARVPRRVAGPLLVGPVLITIAAATNGMHGWLLRSTELVGQPPMLRLYPGPLFFVQSFYTYTVIAVLVVAARRALRTASDLHRRQLTTILVAATFPIGGNMVTLVHFAQGGGGDYAVLGLGATGLLTGWAVFRQGLLRLVPIARGLVLERVGDAVLVLDPTGRVLDLNPAATRLLRQIRPDQPTDLIGLPAQHLLPDDSVRAWLVDGEHSVSVPGHRIDLDTRSSDVFDRRGTLIGRVVVARDVTELNDSKRALRAALRERDELAKALRHQAFHDNLTGLANRALFDQRLADEYARARRHRAAAVVLLVDLDDFKPINDRLGHHAGDLLLQQVAARLGETLREIDTVARLGGDEFAIVLAQPQTEAVTTVAQRILDVLQAPFRVDGEQVGVGVSIGVAVDRAATGNPDRLLRDADAAMYDAKRRGKGSFSVFHHPGERADPA